MQCPTGNGTLRSAYDTNLKAEWDICDTCSGVWFDDLELAKAATYFKTALPPRETFKAVRVPDTGRHTPPKQYTCPKDATPMESYTYAGDSGIQIDRCPNCFGIWLDGGETEKLKEYLRADNTQDLLGLSVIQEMEDFERIKKGIEEFPATLHAGLSTPYGLVRMVLNFAGQFASNYWGIPRD